MAAKPRLTNNSVASLDEQTSVLEEIFEKESSKQKEKDKLKSKKRKIKITSDKKRKVSKPAAAVGVPPVDPELLSDIELDDAVSFTWSEAQRGEEFENMDDESQDWIDDDDTSQVIYPHHVPDHAVSEDEDAVSHVTLPDSEQSVPKQEVLEQITAKGVLGDFLREQLAEVKECDKVTPKLSGGVARIVDKYLKDSIYTADMEKLAKKYPKVDNVVNMKVPKLDTEVFTVLQQNYRNMDQSIQTIQKGVVASLAALAPVLEKVMLKSEEDPELAELGINIADSLKLMAFTLNTLSGRRRELLKPCLAPAYVRVLTKGHETTPSWLFGGDLLNTTKKCEAAKRIAQKVLKGKEPPPQAKVRNNQRHFRAPNPQQQHQAVLKPHIPHQQYQGRFPSPQAYNQAYPYQPLEVGVPTGFPRQYRPRYQGQGQGYQQANPQKQQSQSFPKKLN